MDFGLTETRIVLHLLGVAVWLGGQILMLGLLPVLRSLGGDAPQRAAQGFGRVAWPAFALTVVTGIWNMFAIDVAAVSTGWHVALGIKFMLVIVTGACAFAHQRSTTARMRGITGALGLIATLVALVLGVALSH